MKENDKSTWPFPPAEAATRAEPNKEAAASPTAPPAAATAPPPAAPPPAAAPSLRHRVQMARIERRWSVTELATRAHCDAETLAAFECGDEVLSAELQQRVRAALGL